MNKLNYFLLTTSSTMIIAYATPVIASVVLKYAVEATANVVYAKTTTIISKSAKGTWDYINHKDYELIVEYELVDTDKDDEFMYVTSKKRKDSIDENWINDLEEDLKKDLEDLENSDLENKILTLKERQELLDIKSKTKKHDKLLLDNIIENPKFNSKYKNEILKFSNNKLVKIKSGNKIQNNDKIEDSWKRVSTGPHENFRGPNENFRGYNSCIL